jgi:hypothetical protein
MDGGDLEGWEEGWFRESRVSGETLSYYTGCGHISLVNPHRMINGVGGGVCVCV